MSGYDDFSSELKTQHEHNIKRQKLVIPERVIPYTYKFFENVDCEFHPCHNTKHINCLFCRCPAYNDDVCPGIENGYATILENGYKDCTNCDLPHIPENYEIFMFWESK